MKSFRKIPAFTLSEVLVVLVITGIVVGIAFAVLRLVTLQVAAIRTNYNRSTEVALCKQRLLYDFDEASAVQWDEAHQQLTLTTPEAIIRYEILPERLVRDQDTMALNVQEKVLYLQGATVQEGSIDALRLQLEVSGKSIPLFVSRRSGARDVITKSWE